MICLLVTLAGVVGCRGDVATAAAQRFDLEARLTDLENRPVDLARVSGTRATVFLFTRTDCPISNRYAPEVRRLYEKFAPGGVAFWLVYADPSEPSEAIRAHVKEFAYPCGALRDPHHSFVRMTEARVTPEAAVFSRGGELLYRGRIDDLFVELGKARVAPTRHDLEGALDAVVKGKPAPEKRTDAVGCLISDLK